MDKAIIIVATNKNGVDEFMIQYADLRKGYVCWNPKRLSNAAAFMCERDARSFADAHDIEVNSAKPKNLNVELRDAICRENGNV